MIECQECGSVDLQRRGQRDGWQRYQCNNCGAWTKDKEMIPAFEGRVVGFNSIPDGEDEDFTPFLLHESDYPIIVGADAHIPYHDAKVIQMFIDRAVSIKARTVILDGDWLDCYQLSRFQRDPSKRDIAAEIAMARQIFQAIRSALPDARIIYKMGNHEDRYESYLMRAAPELFKLKSIHLDALPELGLKELNIEVVKNKRIIRIGHLNIIHGHEFASGISAPVNPARGLYLRAKKSAMVAHYHQTSEHTETAINDDVVTCWSIGCLCGLHPQYMPLNKWNHGFAEIMDEDGFFIVRNRRIINGRLL